MIWLLLVLAEAADPPWNCEDPVAQQEMNYCAQQDYLAADQAMNEQWDVTAAEMKRRDADWGEDTDGRPGYFETLLAGQRAWLAFRDAHCASEGYFFRGGSMEPLMVSTCKRKLTEDRTQQLAFLIEQ